MPNSGQPPAVPNLKPIDRALIVGRTRRTAGRVYFGRALLSKTEVAAFPYVVGQALQRPLVGRTVPRPHLASPVLSGRAPRAPAVVVGQAIPRVLTRRAVLPPHLASPVVSKQTFIAPPGTFVGLGPSEKIRRRRFLYATLVAPPIVARTGGSPVPPGTFVTDQAVARTRARLTVPAPHLAKPVTAAPFVAPAATIVGNHFLRRRSRSAPPSTILPPAVVFTPPIARYANFISLGAIARPKRLRNVYGTILPPPIAGQPVVPKGTFASQAVGRAYTRRTVPTPHLATPVPFFLAPRAVIVGQAAQSSLTRRTAPKPHLAGPIVTQVATFVAPPAIVVTSQAIARALTRRVVPAPHLPKLGAAKAVPRGTFVSQAHQRALRGRGPFPPEHLAPPIVAAAIPFRSQGFYSLQALQRAQSRRYRDVPPKPRLAPPVATPAGPGATIKLQSLARQLRRREGQVLLPRLGSGTPVPEGTFLSQSLRRPYVGRTTPGPHLAAPVVTRPAAFLAPAPRVVSQAVARAVLRRSGSVRLPARGSATPVPAGTFVSQAVRRPLLGRGPFPKPHLAPPLVATVPFLAPPALIVGQATERGWQTRLRVAPRPHLASPVPFPPGPGATLRLQAVVGRALLGRGGRVRLPSLGAQPPVPRGTFLGQAVQRPLRGRTVPAAHLAPEIVSQPTFPPNAPGTFVGQAVERSASLLSRRGHVRLAPPVLTQGRTPPALIVSQALRRPYVGRKVIPPHLAPPVRTAAGPGARLYYQAVQRVLTRRTLPLHPRYGRPLVKPPPAPISAFPIVFLQAIERMYIGRKVPPTPSLRYRPIVFVPSQPPVPFPPITQRGITGATRVSGTTAPYVPSGTTDPTERAGETNPARRTGTTNPQRRSTSS